MLVLTRKNGQTITIGDHIRVTVRSIKGSAVTIAIDAPREVAIVREEILHKERRDDGCVQPAEGERVPADPVA